MTSGEPFQRDKILTIYGRKPVIEALKDQSLRIRRLHFADSNKPAPILREISELADGLAVETLSHSRLALSRISRNGKQDQGVALDIECPRFNQLESFLYEQEEGTGFRLLALDGITNPQNLGMIVRSACAGNVDGILIGARGNAALGPLVLKASAGTLFKAPILRCSSLDEGLLSLTTNRAVACRLDGNAVQSLFDFEEPERVVFILGNETSGVSSQVSNLCQESLSIPMNNGVESLNVAVTAALIAFRH